MDGWMDGALGFLGWGWRKSGIDPTVQLLQRSLANTALDLRVVEFSSRALGTSLGELDNLGTAGATFWGRRARLCLAKKTQ